MGLIVCIQRSFEGFLAPFFPRLEPCPVCLPFFLWDLSYFARPLDTPIFWRAAIAPELISTLISPLVIASDTSSDLFGSIQTLFSPHFSSWDAILFWFWRFIFIHSCSARGS